MKLLHVLAFKMTTIKVQIDNDELLWEQAKTFEILIANPIRIVNQYGTCADIIIKSLLFIILQPIAG